MHIIKSHMNYIDTDEDNHAHFVSSLKSKSATAIGLL